MLQQDDKNTYGFWLKQYGFGHFEISHMRLNGSAYNNGKIAVGDYLIAINGIRITETTTTKMIKAIIAESGNTLNLKINSRKHEQGKILMACMYTVPMMNITSFCFIWSHIH